MSGTRVRTSPPILPTLGAAVVLALAAASVLLTLYGPEPPGMTSADTLFFLALSVPLPVALGAMGWLIAWRSKGHPVGLLMVGSAVCLAVMFASGEYQLVSADGPTGLPGATFAGWLSSWMTTPALAMLGIFVPLLFPTGRFLTPRWRRLGLILVGVIVVGTVTTAFLPGSAGNGGNFDNPFGIPQAAPLLEVLNTAFDLCAPVVFGAGLMSPALRFRRGDVRERRQMLTAAAFFQPLRRRIQGAVDRRFNRARYDAERTVAAFGNMLRDEVELTAVGASLVGTVARTLQPAQVALWLRRSA